MRSIANDQVTARQMASLLFSFMTGSSIIFVPGTLITIAGNDSWISMLFGLADCLMMVALMLALYRFQGGTDFVSYCRSRLGPVAAGVLALPFALYLTIMIAWITMGVSDFLTGTSMRNTPDYLFNGVILATAAMTVRAGFEVMARISVLIFAILVMLAAAVLLLSTPNMTFSFLLPVLHNGWMPVLKGSYFLIGFPFGEIIIFMMLLHYTRREDTGVLGRNLAMAVTLNWVLLLAVVLATILVFGPIAGEVNYSLYSVSRLIDVAEFFQRIEAVIGISLIAGSYVKATVALFALNELFYRLLNGTDEKFMAFPAAAVCFLLTLTFFDFEAEFRDKFTMYWPLMLVLAVAPVVLSGIAAALKR